MTNKNNSMLRAAIATRADAHLAAREMIGNADSVLREFCRNHIYEGFEEIPEFIRHDVLCIYSVDDLVGRVISLYTSNSCSLFCRIVFYDSVHNKIGDINNALAALSCADEKMGEFIDIQHSFDDGVLTITFSF